MQRQQQTVLRECAHAPTRAEVIAHFYVSVYRMRTRKHAPDRQSDSQVFLPKFYTY